MTAHCGTPQLVEVAGSVHAVLGEPYRDIASRMTAAIDRARLSAEGAEAVCVSHQLPVWTARQHLLGKKLWHDPRKRQCNVASLTSLVFEGEQLVDVVYSEPAG